MPPEVITRDELAPAPFEIPLGATDAIEPLSAFARFDGTAAAGAFRPTITYYTQDGKVFARAFPADEVAAGESADVSWFPGLTVSPSPASSGGGGAELAYVPVDANGVYANVWAVTGVTPTLVVAAPALTLDGATRIRLEFWTGFWDSVNLAGTTDIGGFIEFYDGGASMGHYTGYHDVQLASAAQLIAHAMPLKLECYLTPTAGAHTFSVYCWSQHAAGEERILAWAAEPARAFIRVSTAPSA